MCSADSSVASILAGVTSSTHVFPRGIWTYKSGNGRLLTYTISSSGEFKAEAARKKIKGTGQLRQIAPWRWSAEISGLFSGKMEFHLDEDCRLVTEFASDGGRLMKITAMAEANPLPPPQVVKESWLSCLDDILTCAINRDEVEVMTLHEAEAMRALHKVFDLVDGFNRRFKSCRSIGNPVFDHFMTQVTQKVAATIDEDHVQCPNWPWRIIWATHVLQCVLSRLEHVTWRSRMFPSSPFKNSLDSCRHAYATALRYCAGHFDDFLAHTSRECQRDLGDKVQKLTEVDTAGTLPYVRLLELSATLASLNDRALAVDEKSARKSAFNLEELVARCVRQAEDFQAFCAEVSPIMVLAACAGVHEEADCVRRVSHCVKYSSELLEGESNNSVLKLAAAACCPRAQRLLVPVVQALCAQPSVKRHMVPSRRGKDAAESIAENMLLPLLRHYPAADLQMLVTSIAIHQIERKWSGREVLNCLLHVEELLRSHLEKDMNEGEEENLSNLRVELHSHDFLCKVVLGACTKHASFASQFLCALPDANIDPNGAWKVSMKLFKLVHPGALPEDASKHLLRFCSSCPKYSQLLLSVLRTFPFSARRFRILQDLKRQGLLEETCAAAARAILMGNSESLWSVPISHATSSGADWLVLLFLEICIPSLSDAPPNSEKEKEFLQWLGAEERLRCPQLVSRRLVQSGQLIHPWLASIPDMPDWSMQWRAISQVNWPSLTLLIDVFGGKENDQLPAALEFFRRLGSAITEGHLTSRAYHELACVGRGLAKPNLQMLVETLQAICALDSERLAELDEQCEELRLEMQRHSQLLEWLVSRWNFFEMGELQRQIKQKLGETEELTLAALEETVKQARNAFNRFSHSKDNKNFEFLQYFLRAGSVLVNPCLEHFAKINASQQSEWCLDSASTLDIEGFGDVVQSCSQSLAVLALGGENDRGAQQTVEKCFFSLVSQELSKLSEKKMQEEVGLLLEYFGSIAKNRDGTRDVTMGVPSEPDLDPWRSRRKVLLDAFRVHQIAQSVQNLQRAFQVMRQDQLLTCECFKQIQDIAEKVLKSSRVNIQADAAKLSELRGLGFADDFHPQLFQTLEQRVCIFDFLLERKFIGEEGFQGFQECLSIARQRLEEDIQVRQALLEELRHCAKVLSNFPALDAHPHHEPERSAMLVRLLAGLTTSQVKIESFTSVAAQLDLLSAIFDSLLGTGSQLLVYTVQKIMEGFLVIDPSKETFHCYYFEHKGGGMSVLVPLSSLLEYSTRSWMSLDNWDATSREATTLRGFLDQMNCILDAEHGLVAATVQLHLAGHPKFQEVKKVAMESKLKDLALERLHRLDKWKHQLMASLEAAPLLGLVPRGQFHSWLAQLCCGPSMDFLHSVASTLSFWVPCTPETFKQRLEKVGRPMNQPMSAVQALEALCVCCEDLHVASVRSSGRGIFLQHAEGVPEEQLLLMVAELFLLSPHGPKRLPRPSEVLFGDWSVPLREVEAFLWRVEHFPEMLFVLVEPSGLPAEGKKQVADWLCKSRECSMAVILTSPWPFPAAAQAQPLRLNKKAEAQRIWEQQSAQVLLYQGAPGPGGAGPSSGKSTSIRRLCRANELDPLQCHLHEGFTAKDFIETEIRSAIFAGQFRQVALHIDLSAYSDFQVAKTFLRNLLLCQVLYDASTGQMVSIPLESTVHVEIGALAGKRDIHALKSYATEELLHSKFPEVPIDQLNLKMIYPILGILGKDCTNEVRNAPLRCGEEAFGEVPALEDDDVELLGVAQSTQATQAPVLAESPAVALRLMHAFLQPHPLEGLGGRKLIDIRPSEVEQLQRLANYGGPELEKLFHDLSPGGFEVDVRRFPDPPNAEGTLQAFASHFGLLVRQEFTKAHEDLILRRVSILAAFMARSYLFKSTEDPSVMRIGSLLVECVGVGLKQLSRGEEVCIHFVPPYTGRSSDDFQFFLPSLSWDAERSGQCPRGPACECNRVRRQLLQQLPCQVLTVDPSLGMSLESALEDERQGVQALSCAFGIEARQVQELLEHEGYILTRDFTGRILELLARWRCRLPVILVGESGTGKTRALELLTLLLLESQQVRPNIPKDVYDYMRNKLRRAKDQASADPVVQAVENEMNVLLEEGFTLQGFKDLLTNPVLYRQRAMDGERNLQAALFTREELVREMLKKVEVSPRFDIGLLHMLLRMGSVPDLEDIQRSKDRWRRMDHAAKEQERSGTTFDIFCRAAGGEGDFEVNDQAVRLACDVVACLPTNQFFFRVQVHAAMTAEQIQEQLQPALDACRREPEMTVVAFLDEVNTSSCLGFVKAILCDQLLAPNPNLFLVAAANPYREEASKEDLVLRGSATVMRDFFQVHPLPPSLAVYEWKWRSCLSSLTGQRTAEEADEERYALLLLRKMTQRHAEMQISDHDALLFAAAIAAAQRFMRDKLESSSAVSQRDVIRAIRLWRFFWQRHVLNSDSAPRGTRLRASRALLLSFGMTYYVGLNSEQRKLFVKTICGYFEEIKAAETSGSVDLPEVLEEEMSLYMEHIDPGPGIAFTKALKENVFAIVVGIECNIPVMIVGMPGTGKTLAVNVATNVLRGDRSVPFFRQFQDVANSVFRYQCSKESTSKQIHELFENALRFKQQADSSTRRCPVVFIDEAALPPESMESLKAMHYWIDQGELFCCVLANKPLDAAKRNRCLQVFRDEADGEDLKVLAANCLGVSLEDPSSAAVVSGFCGAFREISRGQEKGSPLRIFHLRDFHHCLRYLRQRNLVQGGSVRARDVLHSLERNFGGLRPEDFRTLAGIVFKHLEDATGGAVSQPDWATLRSTVDVIREALEDLPKLEDVDQPDFAPCRYKLLIDETEDGSGLRILRSIGLLGGAPVLEVSDLQTDRNQLHRSQIVNEIRRAAEREGTCIITDFDEVLDGFYDLLNLRFQRIQLGDQMNLAATVASGSYSVLTPVHPRFQLVVSIKASDLEQTPLPFLNRFEKFYLTLADVASFKAFDLCHGQISHQMLQNYILQPVRDRLEELVQLIGPASLIGYRAATMDSAILETLQNQEVSEALVKLAATWQDRGSIAARGPRKFESESTGSLPGDLSERQLADIQQQKALSRMRCHGFQNAGSTCYLQACLVLLTLHENLWLGKSDSTISKTLHDIMKRSRLNTVSMEPVMLLEQELKQVGIVAGRQQEDAATTLEGLLDHCGGLKLPLRTETRALPSHDLEDAAVKVLPQAESSEYVLRVPLQGVPRLELLLSAAVQAQVAADTELETETGTLKLPAGSALRMKQRLEGQLPPRLLPICLERWSISGSLMQKNQVQLFVPLEGLELPLLAPSQGRLLVESSECWTYNLRSFVVHIGRTLDSGHYVTYWHSQDGWIEINDASERSIDATTAERKAGDAYLLIYELAGYQGVRTLSGHIPGKQETLRQHQLDAVAAIALGAAGRLMNLAPSEAVLSNMKSLPQELLRGYVLRPHTGLGSLLTHMAHMDCVDRGPRCLVFTRDVLGLHDPLQREDAEIQAMPRSRQEAIALLESRRGKGKPLMVLCRLGATNGGDVECTHRGIDQLRRLADDRDVQGLVVVLLLPPWKLHVAACYQAVFMQSWQIFHLDSLDDSESPGLVSSLLERSEERSSPILHHAVSTVPGGSTPATPSGHSFTTPVTTPVTASVTAPIHSSAEHAELYRDLWTAVGYLTPSESLRSFAEEWLHPAAAFYRADASLQQRVEPLWALLSSPSFKVLLDHLQRIRSEGLYGVSLEQEATVVAQEIMGMKVNQNRPMLCLQTVVRNKCVEKLVSVLAAALRVFCDQGGLKQLVELGNDAVSVTEAYLQMRFASQDAWPAKLTAVFLMPSSNNQYLTCFADLFEKLQECFLDVKAESPSRELQEMLQHTTAAWSKHPFCEVSERVANSGAMHASYCSYLAECLGLPKSAAKLLSKERSLPAVHVFAWYHRLDLSALGLLYQDEVLDDMIQDLQLDQNGNFGQHLADFVLESLEKQLREVSEGCHAKQQLDSWHHSFEAARAMLRGRLALSNKLNQKLGLLSFFSDLIPCLLLHPGGDRILCQLLSEDPRSRGGLQRKCLKTLASQLRDGFQPNSNDLQPNSDRSTVICSARIALQHILEDILWPLRHARDDHVARTFEDVVTFVLDIVDNHGLFAGCYDVVTPALGASAVQALLEVIQQKLDTHPQLIQLFSKSFSHRVQGCSSQVELPLSLHVWIEWPQHDRQMMSTDLPNLLYLALCTPVGRELLKIAEGALARFHLDRASSSGTASGGISFPLVRSVAFSHLLLDEVAAIVANGQWTSEEAKNILQDLCSLGINTPEMLLFFDALVSHAGSTAAAGRALRRLLDVRSPHSNAELSDWAGALEKPERGAGGVGEDPWDDLPVKGMPGYEDEKRRRQREDQEQERLDQLQVSQGGRHCPHCNRVIQQNGGCDQMLCGGHAHTNPLHREGCGREFFWSQARPYQPSVLETRQPPGFSAIATWLMDTDDFISDVADRAAEVALHGLAPADRRYAFANAAACVLLKRGQQKPNLAQALMSKQSLQATLGFEDPSLVPVAGMLCDASAVSASKSLTASLLLGRDGWESTVGTAQKLRNTVVNLLVAVLGGPDNNHLSMLLLKPLHMMNTFPVGFVFGELPGPEGYHFDCGCVLDQQGRASRNRPPLENTHLHFVNFCSWAMLSVGLLIFPQTRAQIQEVLTLRYIREVDPEGLSDVADVACSYAMNFALRCFECVGLCQQLPEDDRALCFFELFHRFRQRAVGLHPALARTFATSDTRHVYEDFWKTLIDQVLEELPQLREEVLRTSQAQEQLLHLQEFRASRSYMHRFFRSFELCSLAVPTAPELSFVSALVTRQEQLAHLPLLGQIVVIQNWISDRLHGIVPESCLDQPLVKLVKQKQKDAEEERHCKRVLCHFESFVKSWKRFYRENEGRLPVECQAGRAALGMETQDSLLEAIDDEDDGTKLPLRFFVNGDEKCQSQVVAEYLCSLWNEMIAAAAAVLRESGGNCELWAGRMERSIPLGLADLLFQDQITEALKSNAFLRRSILRHLRGARGVIAPLVDWTAVQQEILSSAWVHRVQKLDLPPFSRFWPRPETKAVSFDSTAPLDAEVEERVMEFLAQLPLVELQSCREEIARISLHVGDADPRKLVLEMEEISQLRAVLPEQVTALLRGIRVGALNGLREILDQENGEFSHLSKVFMAAPPTEIDLTASLARHFRIRTEATRTVHELAGRDADLRETITNLEESGFCAHLLTSPNTPLLEVYQAVFQCEGVLSQLPCQILGCHLVAVLQSLRVLLRKVRARKCALDRCTCWNPREGIQALSSWAEDESRGPWWEDPQGSEEVTNAAEDVAIVTLAPETMLPWVCWACGTEEIPSHLVHALDPQLRHVLEHCGLKVEEKARPPGDPLEAERKLSKLLDLFEKQVNEFGTVKNSSWQSSLSVKVAHLRTLLDYKECCREKLDEELWRLASSRLGLQGDCALRGAWRRFVGGFAAHASEELEEAVRRVVELPLIVSIIKDAEKYTLEGSKVLLRYKNHYYQLDLIPEPQAEAADAGSIDDPLQGEGVAEPRSLTQRFLRFCASMADRSCRKRLAEKPIQQLEEESSARDRNEERLSRKRVADKPVEVLEQELHSQTRAADKPIGLEKDITGAAGDEATNELTKIEEDGEEDEDSWDIV